jgi:pimeloyl-ACP methyl ester carboxylesterase
VVAPDLQAGLVVAEASMLNYAAAVAATAGLVARPVALVGWSMGGLAAMIAAERADAAALVLLEASPPAEVQGFRPEIELAAGVYDGEAEYGAFPDGMRARPESALARAERKRGMSVPALPARTLVVYGREFPEERGTRLAEAYGAETLEAPGASHWDLVRDPALRPAIAQFLASSSTEPRA